MPRLSSCCDVRCQVRRLLAQCATRREMSTCNLACKRRAIRVCACARVRVCACARVRVCACAARAAGVRAVRAVSALCVRVLVTGYLAPFRVQRYDLSHSSASGTTATISLELPEAGCEWCTVDGSRDPHAHLTRVGVGLATALDPTKAIWGALLDGLKKAYGTELDGVRLLRHSHIYLPADGDKDQVLATIDVATGGSGREQSCETVAVGASAIDAALVAIADAIEYAVLDGTPLCILPEQEENGFISQKAPQEPRGGALRVSTSTYSI